MNSFGTYTIDFRGADISSSTDFRTTLPEKLKNAISAKRPVFYVNFMIGNEYYDAMQVSVESTSNGYDIVSNSFSITITISAGSINSYTFFVG